MQLRQKAPAKINLALDVLGPRPDGYHEMRMVMQTVGLCDALTLEEAGEGFRFKVQGAAFAGGKKSLEEQATEAFFQELGRPMPGLRVTLEKQIPAYAGLGGGSADVAALLRGLRERYAPELPLEKLEEIGLTVGSDVPFCIEGGTVLAEGRGENLKALKPLPECKFVICKPDFDLPTGEMFGRLRFGGEESVHPDINEMTEAIRRGDLRGIAHCVGNVFEEVLEEGERREIEEIKETLKSWGALAAAMSGSGPAVFGLFAPEAETDEAVEYLKHRYTQVFKAEPVNR